MSNRTDSSTATVSVAPLPAYRHVAHWRKGKRFRRLMWTALVLFAFVSGFLFSFLPLALLPALLLPTITLAALVIWALPGTGRAPIKSLTLLYFAFFMSLIAWPNYLAITIPGLPWITLLRLFGFPMAVVLLLCLSRSVAFRAQVREVLVSAPLIWKLLTIFVAIQLFTLPFSPHLFSSFSKFIIAQVNWTAVFFVSCYVFRSTKNVFRWTFISITLALFTVGLGGWEWRLQHVPWAGHIPSFLAVSDEAVQRVLAGATRVGLVYRTQSTFTTSLSFAEYLAMTVPFVIHLAVEGKHWITRAAAMSCVPIIFFGVFITNSRLGMLGFFLSLLLYLAIWAVRRWKSDPTSIFGPALTIGYPAMFASFVVASLVNLRLYRMIWGGGQYQFSTDARREQVEMAIPKILHMPIGHGIGQAADALGYLSPAGLLTIDSYYLSIALEYGILGFVVYYGMLIVGVAYGGRAVFSSRSYEASFLIPAVISVANFLVIKSVLSQEANHPLAFMMLGMICALVHRSSAERAAV